ncbi:hypothetical protein [Paenibacillus rigui]|uniref:Uncharacterized protein n=1 Tax=Paenibacillus rigui TaxID=554312 RepID=A0A229UKR3_9BACL|nr:hypothetical protein [Paenibacillus rigui]OXM83972.1 hypothetical protein CF651_22935 [Paenibacillus rigui]
MEETTQSGSQTVESHQTQDNALQDAFEAFGIPTPNKQEENPTEQGDNPPAIEEETSSETKKISVKFNKEDVEIDEAQVPELLQKGLALEKVRERNSEYQRALDRAAKLQGFDSHEDFIANLDKIEAQQKKAREDEYEAQRNDLLNELEIAGIDRTRAEKFIDNHPLMQQARRAIEEKQQIEQVRQQETVQQQAMNDWAQLYDAFPETRETSQLFTEGKNPDWYTEEMQAMIQMGYKPLHAFKLSHMDKLNSQTRKQVEQKLIKEQRLGSRAQVVTDASGATEEDVPVELATAFSLFGLNPNSAKKYVKK